MADNNDLSPTTAVEAAAAPQIDISAAPSTTTGTATLADDVAMAASSLTAASSAPGTGAATPNPGTGTTTPFLELDENGRRLSLGVSLADICAKAARLYTIKNYEEAAELYAQAAEWQAEMNGEMSPNNAEVLFRYGQALFKVGQSNSDVLGNKAPVAGEEGVKKTKKAKKTGGTKPAEDVAAGDAAEKAIEDKVATIAEEATEAKKIEDSAEKKPLFQFTGDENFDESDEVSYATFSSLGQRPAVLTVNPTAGRRRRWSRGRRRRG
jgi:HAT1-interacting factor 1